MFMAPLSLKLHEEHLKIKKTQLSRNTHKILKWINLLIKEMVEKSLSSKWNRLFLFHLLETSVASLPTETKRRQFFIPTDSDFLLQCGSCHPPRHSGIQRWANGVLGKARAAQIPAAAAHWLTWGLRAWYSPSKLGRSGMSRLQQRIISSKRDGGHSGGP